MDHIAEKKQQEKKRKEKLCQKKIKQKIWVSYIKEYRELRANTW